MYIRSAIIAWGCLDYSYVAIQCITVCIHCISTWRIVGMLYLCHPSVPLRWTATCNLCASTSMPIITRMTQSMASIDCMSYLLVGLCSVVIGHDVLTWYCLQPVCLAWCGRESMTLLILVTILVLQLQCLAHCFLSLYVHMYIHVYFYV